MKAILTVHVNDLEEDAGHHLHPDGEVAETRRSVAEISPHVEPLGEGNVNLITLFGLQGFAPRRDHCILGIGTWKKS